MSVLELQRLALSDVSVWREMRRHLIDEVIAFSPMSPANIFFHTVLCFDTLGILFAIWVLLKKFSSIFRVNIRNESSQEKSDFRDRPHGSILRTTTIACLRWTNKRRQGKKKPRVRLIRVHPLITVCHCTSHKLRRLIWCFFADDVTGSNWRGGGMWRECKIVTRWASAWERDRGSASEIKSN